MAHRTEDHSNLKLFRNRLWKLMEEKHIFTTKELAKILYNKKLVTVKQRYSYDNFSKIYGNAIESVDKKIQKHLRSDTTDGLQGEYVMAYCQFFGCSSDFLFGFIDCKTHDKQFVSDNIGLSEKAIDELHYIKLISDTVFGKDDIDLNTINILLEELVYQDNSIIHSITTYLCSIGLQDNIYYNPVDGCLSKHKIMNPEINSICIPANTDTFDNLLLIDIQKRLVNLKNRIKERPAPPKAPDTF